MPDSGRVYLEGGFEPRKIYEVVYVSENPPLVGLGPAGIRDAVSRIKYEGAQELGIGEGEIDRAIAFGISQSGRFLRTFLYYGFNEDESRRRVFDGVIAHVAGGGRGSFNHRFAQASRDAHPYINFFYPTDIFPFTDLEQVDGKTGVRDGILTRQKPEHQPKVFYTNSSYEYWGRAASLIHTSIDALEDAKIPENVRVYHFAGSQHGPARFPPEASLGQQKSNPMDFRFSMRALLVSMDSWIREEGSPPESRYARVEEKTLVKPEALGFPAIPGVGTSSRVHKAYRASYGESFRSEGIVTKEPPSIDGSFPMMVPAVDADGNEKAGIRLPELEAPLATYTGWNLFNSKSGPESVLSSMQGSYIPFARDEAERKAKGDPRPSIAERYPEPGALPGPRRRGGDPSHRRAVPPPRGSAANPGVRGAALGLPSGRDREQSVRRLRKNTYPRPRAPIPVDFQQKKMYLLSVHTGGAGVSPKDSEVPYGTLDLMVLRTLEALGPLHGYGIARRIEEAARGSLALNQGTIYPALLRLQQKGWIRSSWGTSENNRRARFYDITRAGRKQLAAEAENWGRAVAMVNRILDNEA